MEFKAAVTRKDHPLYNSMKAIVIATYCAGYGLGILVFGGLGFYWWSVVHRWAYYKKDDMTMDGRF